MDAVVKWITLLAADDRIAYVLGLYLFLVSYFLLLWIRADR